MSEQQQMLTSAKEIAFGSISGIAGKLFEYPFDTVKVRLQSQPDGKPLQFSGPVDCFQQTWRNEGINGFYRGIASPLIGAAAENASLFVSYEASKSALRSLFYPTLSNSDRLPMQALLVCGATSGAFTSFILTPIELIKCKMQVQNLSLYDSHTKPPSSSSKAAYPAQRTQSNGISGFWRGQLGTLFRETGGSAAWFGAYEFMSSLLRASRPADSQSNSQFIAMVSGACAGIAYNISLFPADSVKSRMQTDSVLGTGDSQQGFWTVAKNMYKSGGIKVLYRGCGMTVARAAPSSAIIFLVYENLKANF
ncbi:mitochondrial carrier domain-containing protein, partial [Myxozyma melibiosi]